MQSYPDPVAVRTVWYHGSLAWHHQAVGGYRSYQCFPAGVQLDMATLLPVLACKDDDPRAVWPGGSWMCPYCIFYRPASSPSLECWLVPGGTRSSPVFLCCYSAVPQSRNLPTASDIFGLVIVNPRIRSGVVPSKKPFVSSI